jgi:RNA chaperone Hfq
MHEQNYQAHRRFSADAGRPSLRPRPRPETQNKKPARRQLDAHEHVLLNSKRSASSVTVTLMSGKEVEGVVIDFDRYSFSIKQSDGVDLHLFKHAVAMFSPVASRA